MDLKSFWEKHYLLFHPHTTAAATHYIESFFTGEARSCSDAVPIETTTVLQVQGDPHNQQSVRKSSTCVAVASSEAVVSAQ